MAALQQECSDIIGSEGNDATTISTLEDKLSTLGSMLDNNPAAVFPALKDLHTQMAMERDVYDDDSYDDAIELVEGFILDGSSAYETAMAADRPSDELNDRMDSVDLSGLNEERQQIAQIAALADYATQTSSGIALDESRTLASKALVEGNLYVFDNVSDAAFEYIPTKVLAAASGMRHVWNERYQSATLARGMDYYTFVIYSDLVERDKTGDRLEYLSRPTKYQGGIYVPEDYCIEGFGLECRPIPGTGLAVALDSDMADAAEELLAALLRD